MGKNKYIHNVDFFTKWSPDMAYILGFITADGCILNNNTISIVLNPKDIEILQYIKNCLSPQNNIKIYQQLDKRNNQYYHKAKLAITCKKMVNDLYNLGIVSRKTGKEIIPQDLPHEYFYDFLRGVFDGDGWVRIDKSHPLILGFCSASNDFITQIQKKINAGRISKIKNNNYQLIISSYQAFDIRDLLYKNAPFYLKRKYNLAYSLSKSDLLTRRFDDDELLYLKNNYHNIKCKEIAKTLNRDYRVLTNKARQLKLSKQTPKWTNEETQYLLNNYDAKNHQASLKNISLHLNKRVGTVYSKLQRSQSPQLKNYYTIEETNFINKNYHRGYCFLCEALNRNEKSIKSKLYRMGLQVI